MDGPSASGWLLPAGLASWVVCSGLPGVFRGFPDSGMSAHPLVDWRISDTREVTCGGGARQDSFPHLFEEVVFIFPRRHHALAFLCHYILVLRHGAH